MMPMLLSQMLYSQGSHARPRVGMLVELLFQAVLPSGWHQRWEALTQEACLLRGCGQGVVEATSILMSLTGCTCLWTRGQLNA